VPAVPRAARLRTVAEALAVLRNAIDLEQHDPCPGSHTVVRAAGIERLDVAVALGTYLVGVVAGAVSVDLTLSDRYLGEDLDELDQLRREVERAVGSSNDVTTTFKENRRNPWIAECLGHLLLMVAGDEPGLCVPGRVWAATVPHDKVSQQGLDFVAVWEDEELPALCVGECKASESNGGAHLNASIRLFREIDDRARDQQIRVVVINSLEQQMPPEIRDAVPGMFWRDRRLYLPVISYSSASSFNPVTNRPTTFGALLVAVDRRRCVAIPLGDYCTFFDTVADAMRFSIELFGV
jgi:hypothetical protein